MLRVRGLGVKGFFVVTAFRPYSMPGFKGLGFRVYGMLQTF